MLSALADRVLSRRLGIAVVVCVGATLGGGCYEPVLVDCTIQCQLASDCANGQVCGDDGYCAGPDVTGTCTASDPVGGTVGAIDGGIGATDGGGSGGQPDGPKSTCQSTCPGSCVSGTCVIDCTATDSCQGDVMCPAGIPCRVACGDGACQRVRCDLAASCDIECTGRNSCAERVTCGSGRCDVSCTGFHACRRGVDCHDACACSVTCDGTMACHDVALCPTPSCRAGRGCTDVGSSCSACGP